MSTLPVAAAAPFDADPVRPPEAFAALLGAALDALPAAEEAHPLPERPRPAPLVPPRLAGIAAPEGLGTLALPERLDLLTALLTPPADDGAAQDLLAHCWPQRCGETSRAALAVALALAHRFGRPDRLPMTCLQAWRLLDPVTFRPALLHRLANLCALIADDTAVPPLLPLDYGELELIDTLFEALDPGEDPAVLAGVLSLTALGDRRLALVQRIPLRARQRLEAVDPADRASVRPGLLQSRALLDVLAGQKVDDSALTQAALEAGDELDRLISIAETPHPVPGDSR